MSDHVASSVQFVAYHVRGQISCFRHIQQTSQERNRSRQASRAREDSSIRILQPFLFSLQISPLPVLGDDGGTLLSLSHRKDTSAVNFSINRQDVIVFVNQSDNIADVSIQRG